METIPSVAAVEENPGSNEQNTYEADESRKQILHMQHVSPPQSFAEALSFESGHIPAENALDEGNASGEAKDTLFQVSEQSLQVNSDVMSAVPHQLVAISSAALHDSSIREDTEKSNPDVSDNEAVANPMVFATSEVVRTPLPNQFSGQVQRTLSGHEGTMAIQSPLEIGAGRNSEQRKRIQLDGLHKKFICELKRDNPKFTAADISNAFCERYHRDLPRSTVSDILKRASYWLRLESDTHQARVIRHRAVKFPAIEESLYEWFQQVRIQGGTLSDQILIERAKAIRDELSIPEAEFKVSNGWLQNFKRRHNIKPFTGEVETEFKALPVLIKESNCKPEDVFAFEERGLYYRAPPLKSLLQEAPEGKLKSKMKDLLTVGLCVHAGSSPTLPPIVIGKEEQLNCFGKAWTPATAGVQFYSNPSGTMTTEIFADWVGKVNHQMLSQRRHILLFVSDSPAHRIPDMPVQDIRGYQGYKFSHVTIIYLIHGMPAFQPLDLGIFQSFHCWYKKLLVSWLLEQLESSSDFKVDSALLSMKQAIGFIQDAWQSLEPALVRACWAKSYLLPREWSVDIVDPEEVERNKSISSANELVGLTVRLNLDSEVALPVTEYLNMPGEASTFDEISMDEFGVMCGQKRKRGEDPALTREDVMAEEMGIGSQEVSIEKARECADTLESFFASEGNQEGQAVIHQMKSKIKVLMGNKTVKAKAVEEFFEGHQF